VNSRVQQQLDRSKRRIERRLDKTNVSGCERPMFTASDTHYEISDRDRGITHGGIGALHAMVRKVGLVEAIDQRLHLFRFHLPYHESDHVLNLAYNALCECSCLQDIELRCNDETFLDALGARRIPDPTTVGNIHSLQDAYHEIRLKVWAQQPDTFFEQAIIDMDGTLVSTTVSCKQGMDIAYAHFPYPCFRGKPGDLWYPTSTRWQWFQDLSQ
jgi:hypothetical protein